MRRREFIGVLGAIAAWPQAVAGEAAKRRPLIAWLGFSTKDAPLSVRYNGQFLAGMRELHYIEGRDFDMVYGFADFDTDRLPRVAAQLVELAPDVILAPGPLQAIAARKATDRIPIVVGVLADPVGLGFATSDARPTGNVTGISPYVKGLPAKQLELARELVAGATRIGLLNDIADPKAYPQRQEIEAAGKAWTLRSCLRTCGQRPTSARRTMPWRLPVSRLSWWRRATCCSLRATNCRSSSGEEIAYGLWVSRACRGRGPDQLRCRSGLVFSSLGVLRRSNTECRPGS